MKQALATLVLVLLPSLAAADLAEIKARGTLRVLYVPSHAPDEFFYPPNQERPGFDRELLDGFAQLQRVKLEPVPIPAWDELAPALAKGRGDLVAGRYSVTDSRRKLVNFSAEAFPTRHVVLTRKPTRVVTTLEELLHERIGTVRGSSMAEALAAARVPSGRIDDSLRPGLQAAALADGRVTAVVMGVENAISEQRRDASLQLGMFLGPPGSLAYAVRKEDPELQRALDAYIESARRSTAWSRLVVKYFGEAAVEVLKKARAE